MNRCVKDAGNQDDPRPEGHRRTTFQGLAEWQIDRDAKKMWRIALRYSALGIEMGVAVAIGYVAGWWLDKRFGTAPYLTLVMLLLGIAAGFRGLIRVALEVSKRDAAGGNGEDGER